MSTGKQLNWHDKYRPTVTELHNMRLENDALNKRLEDANLEAYKLKRALSEMVSVQNQIKEILK